MNGFPTPTHMSTTTTATPDICPFTVLLMVVASGAIAMHFTRDRTHVDAFSRTTAMMHRLFELKQAQVEKLDSGAYVGRERLLKEDVERLEMYVPFILQNVLDDKTGHRARIRHSILFEKLEEVNWLIPVDGPLMKELEGCELEVNNAAVVVVSSPFLAHPFLFPLTLRSRKTIDRDWVCTGRLPCQYSLGWFLLSFGLP